MSEKKIAIVTGASRGIGKAIALELARQGIFVVINYNGSKEKAEEALRTIQNEGGDGVIYQCNVADFEACKTFIEDIVSTYGRIDILVNNAGITKDGLLMRMSEADFSEVVDINLKGTFHCIHHVARPMLKQKSGRIINLASVVALHGNAGQVNYAASKAGIIGMTKSAAKELASRHITVNAIAPGFIQTPWHENRTQESYDRINRKIALHRFGEIKDVADMAYSILTNHYMNGSIVDIHGGYDYF